MIEQQIKTAIRDIHDFPKPGIIFKDITPILKDPILCDKNYRCFFRKTKGYAY
jgi:adenine phosphoribosyltransferase